MRLLHSVSLDSDWLYLPVPHLAGISTPPSPPLGLPLPGSLWRSVKAICAALEMAGGPTSSSWGDCRLDLLSLISPRPSAAQNVGGGAMDSGVAPHVKASYKISRMAAAVRAFGTYRLKTKSRPCLVERFTLRFRSLVRSVVDRLPRLGLGLGLGRCRG
jgi:hypothetical protein